MSYLDDMIPQGWELVDVDGVKILREINTFVPEGINPVLEAPVE